MTGDPMTEQVKSLKLFEEPRAKLIVNRRAIAAGLAALVATPFAGRALERKLGQLSNVPMTFDPSDFVGQMQDGLFLPDYRCPMARIVFEDGGTTRWMRWAPNAVRNAGRTYSNDHTPTRDVRAVALETCAPDKNGMPRYTQLAIG